MKPNAYPKIELNNRIRNWIGFIALVGLALSVLNSATFLPDFDIDQMLSKGAAWVHTGKLICYGNKASAGMGNIPGCLSSLAVGLPFLISETPQAVLAWIIFSQFLAFGIVWPIFRRHYSWPVLALFSVYYFLSQWRLEQVYIWNPAYLFLPAALHLRSSYESRSNPSFLWSFINVLAIGYAVQFHLSAILLAGASIALFATRKVRVHWTGVAVASVIVLTSLIPYYFEIQQNAAVSPAITHSKSYYFRGIALVYPIVKSIWNWITFSSTGFAYITSLNISWNWISIELLRKTLELLWMPIAYLIAAATIGFSLFYNFVFVKRAIRTYRRVPGPGSRSAGPGSDFSWLDHYAWILFVTIIVFTAASPLTLLHWHILIAYFATLIPLLNFAEQQAQHKKFELLLLAMATFLTLHAIWISVESKDFRWDANPLADYQEKLPSFIGL